MTYKAIRYSDHASKRLRQRGISRAMVRETLIAGEDWPVATEAGSPYHGRQRRYGQRTLQVSYLEGPNGIFITNAQWKGEAKED